MATTTQHAFLHTAREVGALTFGQFELKSGRISPYFFNAGAFCTGHALNIMASAYAERIHALIQAGVPVDSLYGPAYKGIPLVAAVAVLLAERHQLSLPWTFNRKEAKNHGEGGMLVGAVVKGKNVLIIDDVLTAGTACGIFDITKYPLQRLVEIVTQWNWNGEHCSLPERERERERESSWESETNKN